MSFNVSKMSFWYANEKKKNPDYATDDPNNHIICKIATTVILFIQIPGDKAVTYIHDRFIDKFWICMKFYIDVYDLWRWKWIWMKILFEEAIKEDCDLEYISECCWTYL